MCNDLQIKKFRDALEKHNNPRCSLVPPRGLGEDELLALSKNKSLYFNMPALAENPKKEVSFVIGFNQKEKDLARVSPGKNPYDMAHVGLSHKSDQPSLVGSRTQVDDSLSMISIHTSIFLYILQSSCSALVHLCIFSFFLPTIVDIHE